MSEGEAPLGELLTEHTPTPETHHIPCDAPWMTSHTVEADGQQTASQVCPACGSPRT